METQKFDFHKRLIFNFDLCQSAKISLGSSISVLQAVVIDT